MLFSSYVKLYHPEFHNKLKSIRGLLAQPYELDTIVEEYANYEKIADADGNLSEPKQEPVIYHKECINCHNLFDTYSKDLTICNNCMPF